MRYQIPPEGECHSILWSTGRGWINNEKSLNRYLLLYFSSFSGKEEGQTEKEKQIDQIYFAYGKKLSPIAEVRYKALDIKDESLGALFEKFHSEMHNIDTMILNALKASFEVIIY